MKKSFFSRIFGLSASPEKIARKGSADDLRDVLRAHERAYAAGDISRKDYYAFFPPVVEAACAAFRKKNRDTLPALLADGYNHAVRDALLAQAEKHGMTAAQIGQAVSRMPTRGRQDALDDLLIAAAEKGSPLVPVLLEAGACVGARCEEPLRRAARNGHDATARLLCARGADLKAALFYAPQHSVWRNPVRARLEGYGQQKTAR